MRELVVQFMNEVGDDFQLSNVTIGASINVFDRFLATEKVLKNYQLEF